MTRVFRRFMPALSQNAEDAQALAVWAPRGVSTGHSTESA
jgi:hypothetical protein